MLIQPEVKVEIDRLVEIEVKLADLAAELKRHGVEPEGIQTARRAIRERIGTIHYNNREFKKEEKIQP